MKMNKKISMGLRKRFSKDYKTPFKLLTDPYFEYFLDLYKKDFNLIQPLEDMEVAVESLGGEKDFETYFYKLFNTVVGEVKAMESYKRFNETPMPKVESPSWKISKNSPYNNDYKDEFFVSIDLVKANFQVMKDFDKDLVLGSDNYREFISKYTPFNYFQNSKQLRQVIFGNLNSKRQQAYQKRIMNKIIELLFSSFDEKQFRGLTSDEVFIHLNKDNFNSEIESVFNKMEGFKFETRIEIFKLVSLGNKCFVKEIYDREFNLQKVEFKNVPGHLSAQAYKKYYGLELNEKDMTFLFEGQEAVLKQPCF